MLSYLRNHHAGLLALFIALSGTSYAVETGSIDGREIRNNSVTTRDLRNNSVLGRDLRNGRVSGRDLRDGTVSGRDLRDGTVSGRELRDAVTVAARMGIRIYSVGFGSQAGGYMPIGEQDGQTLYLAVFEDDPGLDLAECRHDLASQQLELAHDVRVRHPREEQPADDVGGAVLLDERPEGGHHLLEGGPLERPAAEQTPPVGVHHPVARLVRDGVQEHQQPVPAPPLLVGLQQRQRELLEKRYDLRDDPSDVMMSGGRKAVQQGVRVKLNGDATWESLAEMSPEEIKENNLFPYGFRPLPHVHCFVNVLQA